MKKKVTLILLALVLCLSGAVLAAGCGGSSNKQWTVNFCAENGDEYGQETVMDGEKVSEDAVFVSEKEGYTVVWKNTDGSEYDFDKPVKGNLTLILSYVANSVAYKVEHYTENLDGEGYTLEETENLTGLTDQAVTAADKAMEGFSFDAANANNVVTGTVKGNGSLVLKKYYKRNEYTITYVTSDDDAFDTATVKYGATVAKTNKTVEPANKTATSMDEFKYWSATNNGAEYNFSTPVSGNLTLYAVYENVTREYNVSFAPGAGLFTYRDADNGLLSNTTVTAGDDLVFSIRISNEAEGTPVVKMVTTNDEGVTADAVTLTAVDGTYTVSNVTADTAISVEGLTAREYTVSIAVADAPFPAGTEWAKTYKDIADVAVRITNYVTDETTLQAGCISNGIATLTLTAGEYSVEFVVEKAGDFVSISSDAIEFDVAYNKVVEGTTSIVVEDSATIGLPEIQFVGNTADNFSIENGYVTGEIANKDGGHLNAQFVDFAPGHDDFIATVTFEKNGVFTESDPMFGFSIVNSKASGIASFNKAGMRIRGFTSSQVDRNGFVSGGNVLSKDDNGYDTVTYTLARKGDAFYVFFSGTHKGNLPTVTNKLMCVINAESLTFANGNVLTTANGLNATAATLLSEGVDALHIEFQMTTEAPFKMYGYGYSADATVIGSYLDGIKSNVVTYVDGQKAEEATLNPGETFNYSLALPSGKVVDKVTINNTPVAYNTVVDAEGAVYATFDITASLVATNYNVQVTLKEGSIAALKGKVNSTAKDITVTVDGVQVNVNANGEFTAFVIPGGTYVVKASAADFKPAVVKVTDLTKTVELTVDGKYEITADSVTLDGVVLSGMPGPGIAEGATTTTYVHDVDDDGNEILKSIPGTTTKRDVVLFNYTGSRFVAETSVKYETAPDTHIRIGFFISNGDGTFGDIAMYGRQWSSTKHDGWKVYNAATALPGNANLLGGHYVEAGEIRVRLVYDNGNVQLYASNAWMFGDNEWHLYYEGLMPVAGTKFEAVEGDVVVGLYETSNATPTCTFYNYSIKDLPEVVVPESEDYTTSFTFVNGKPTMNITLNNYGEGGKEIESVTLNGKAVELTVDANTGTYSAPIDFADYYKGGEVEINIVNYRARVDYTGTITVDGKSYEGASIVLVGADGVAYSTTTAADGKWTIQLPDGGYTAVVSYDGAFSREITFAKGNSAAIANVDLVWGFGKVINNKKLHPAVEITYDMTAENPYDGLVIYQPAYNQDIPWSQPIAKYASWGFTLSFPENFAMMSNGMYYDEDVYLKWYLFDGAEKTMGVNSSGQNYGGTQASTTNYFQKTSVGSASNWKDYTSAGVQRPIDVRYVREAGTVKMYIKFSGTTEWWHLSTHTVNADVELGYYTISAARHNVGKISYTYTNIYYYEGAVDAKADITVKNADNATLTVDKTTAGMNETVSVVVKANAGYAVTDILANGKPVFGYDKFQTSADGKIVTDWAAAVEVNAYNDYEITPVVKATADFKTVTGKVTFGYENYDKYYSTIGSVQLEASNGTKYVGQVLENGNYTVLAPAGTYTVNVETAQLRGSATVTVTAEGGKADVVLTTPTNNFYDDTAGCGLVPTADGSLRWKYWGGTHETRVAGVTYTPNKQILEFGYTLTGMNNTVHHPHLGMYIQSGAGKIGRLVFNGAGDTMILMSNDDYSSRLALQDVDNNKFFGHKCNLDSKGNPVAGVDQCYTWDNTKWYNKQMPYSLSVKFIWDGYTFKMYAQTGLMKSVAPNEWSLITEGYNIYDRYVAANKQNYADSLWALDQACYFGITCRLDTPSDHKTINNPTFSNIWFNIYDKPVA